MNHLGSWQQGIADELKEGFSVHNPISVLAGKASGFVGRYQVSLNSLVRQMVSEGYVVVKTLGPRGGSWSSDYRAVKSEGLGAFVVESADNRRFCYEIDNAVWKGSFSPATHNLEDSERINRELGS